MLEDHSPTSRSSSRKTFRRRGAKTVVFNNSCTYYQLDSLSYDTSDGEDDGEGAVELITDSQIDDFDQEPEVESQSEEEKINPLQSREDFVAEMNTLIDNEDDTLHPRPRIGMDSIPVSSLFYIFRPSVADIPL